MIDIDVIVVGGGHAGVEAALAAARMGLKTFLFTLNKNKVANMPCNPSIGGPAKGIVVREIDALGGEMGKAADATYLQMKMLNTAKGPGVQCLRAQSDKVEYSKYMLDVLEHQSNLFIIEEMVSSLIVENNVCLGVVTPKNEYKSKTTILTTGTYMEAMILVGHKSTSDGPDGEKPSIGLSKDLSFHGLELFRLKTGTPPRIYTDSIDFSKMEIQPGTEENKGFSYSSTKFKKIADQELCYLIHTTDYTKEVINDNLKESALFGGNVTGVGPRYCPSIEDKVVRFSDKERHQLFLEPESLHMDTTYVQGFSTSMPEYIQETMIHSLPGLENARIKKYAYAIEYDAIVPTQLWPTLELKNIKNLFSAGQINGTSGYEEAAGQGIIAGINAGLKIKNKEPFILRRDESYIGVMIDDLVTKGTNEPYRLLTSRAEYRLLLRHDNADLRLREYGYKFGLINESEYNKFISKKNNIDQAKKDFKNIRFVKSDNINNYLEANNFSKIETGVSLFGLIKRPKLYIYDLKIFAPSLNYSDEVLEEVEIQIKYEGYINKQEKEALSSKKLEDLKLPLDIDYNSIDNIAMEARQKLNKIKPINIGQASRISGVNPADIAVLIMLYK